METHDLRGIPHTCYFIVTLFARSHAPSALVFASYGYGSEASGAIAMGTPADMLHEAERQATRRCGRFAALRIPEDVSRDNDSTFGKAIYIYVPLSFGRWEVAHTGLSLETSTHDVYLRHIIFFMDHPQWLADRLNEMQLREPLLAALGHPLWRKFFVEIDGDHAMLSRVLSF